MTRKDSRRVAKKILQVLETYRQSHQIGQKLTFIKGSAILGDMLNEKKYPPLDGYLSITEAAKILGKSRQATYQQIKRRKIAIYKAGALLIIHKTDLDRLR